MTHVWQPVKGETIIRCDCGECSRSVYVNDGVTEIFDDTDGEELTAHLPDEYALCRRVPAQGVSVPYPIRSVLDAALIVYITECRQVDDPDGEALAHQAQQWLDSQRQGQQQEADE